MPSRRTGHRGKSKSDKRRRRPKMNRTRPDRRAMGALGDSNFIAQSIENMYRIVEPWQRQGEDVARKFSRTYGSLDMPSGARDVHGRFLTSGGDLLASWMELLAFYTDWVAGAPQTGGAARHTDESSTNIAYEVRSKRAIFVQADIDEDVQPDDLVARRIRKKDGLRARFREENGITIVSLAVNKNAKPGRYSSDIVDDYSDDVVGYITIKVR